MRGPWMPVIATALLVASGVGPSLAQSRTETYLRPRYAAISAAVAKGDLAAVTAVYAADATFEIRTPQGQDRVKGADAIASQWQNAISGGAVTFDVTITDAKLDGDVIVEQGSFVMKKKDATVFASGTYTSEWNRAGTVWKLARHAIMVTAQAPASVLP
jgi:ketosteroid isomerase-like protein